MTNKILLCAAGVQGSIGTTIAAGACMMDKYPESIRDYLITSSSDSALKGFLDKFDIAGWDVKGNSFATSYEKNSPIKKETFDKIAEDLKNKIIFNAPDYNLPINKQIELIRSNIKELRRSYNDYLFVGVNILPATDINFQKCNSLSLDEILNLSGKSYRDIAYLIAFIEEGIPFINFTPNPIELDAIIKYAIEKNTTLCGRDGKTGQTYFKVVLASALRARRLIVNGWYSTNILGNADGDNLKDSNIASNKILQKGMVLNKSLGYEVKNHIVHIDYYPPRGDNKEANDVIDFTGFLTEEMSMRVNMLCKDSVLAAPMIIDMAIISAYLKYKKELKGPLSELAFFFKCPVVRQGEEVNTFQEQLTALDKILL